MIVKSLGLAFGAALIAAAPGATAADIGPNTQLGPDGIVLANVTISVGNLEKSAKFYQALGFEAGKPMPVPAVLGKLLEAGDDPKAEIQFLKRDGTVIELIHFSKPAVKAKASKGVAQQLGLAHFGFRVDDTDRVAALVKANGGTVLAHTRTKLGAPGKGNDIVFCTDPDGVRLEVVGPVKD